MKVFFYGLFMDETLLTEQGLQPQHSEIGFLKGYQLKIANRATLIPRAESRAYGVVMEITPQEATQLYAETSVADYVPVPVTVELLTGEQIKASCFVLPEGHIQGTNPAYAASLLKLATKKGFPESYLKEIRGASCDDGEGIPPGPVRAPRSFSEIHRDVWRLVLQNPIIFVVLPAVVWLPTNYFLELWSAVDGLDEWQQTRRYLKLSQVANGVVGTLVSAVGLAALGEIGRGRAVTVGIALKKGFDLWIGLVLIALHIALRVGLAFLLLVLPGIYLALRYALSAPVVAFEDIGGKKALERSAALMQGHYRRVFLGVGAAGLLYVPIGLLPVLFVPDGGGPGLTALAGIPMSVLVSFVTLGLALIYADLRVDAEWAAPVGQVDPSNDNHGFSPRGTSGVGGVALAVSISAFAFLSFVGAVFYQEHLIERAEEAWQQEQYQESLELYQKAEAWGADDPYLQYSLGWAFYQLDQPEEAESRFARAVEMDPESSYYRLDHARALITLERFGEAKRELAQARSLGFEDLEVLEQLEALAEPSTPEDDPTGETPSEDA